MEYLVIAMVCAAGVFWLNSRLAKGWRANNTVPSVQASNKRGTATIGVIAFVVITVAYNYIADQWRIQQDQARFTELAIKHKAERAARLNEFAANREAIIAKIKQLQGEGKIKEARDEAIKHSAVRDPEIMELTTELEKSLVLYRTIEQWPIGNQGHGQTIVTTIPKPSQAQLKAVVEQLKAETRADRVVFAWIYDDDGAARNHRAATKGTLSPAEESSYARHFVAQYQRNANSGHHSLFVYPNGGNGPHIEIKY